MVKKKTNEIVKFDVGEIQVTPGTIVFTEYESLKQQALDLAYNIEMVEVTDENIKTSKKMVAAVSKRVKEIEDRRIAIKKDMLQAYNDFEAQVKEIVNIVKGAESIVRDQVREMEERERDEKREAIHEIFTKRLKHYKFDNMIGFDDFIKPNHLNKTTTMKSIENEMVEWLEKKETDFQVIKSLPNAEEVMVEYLDTKDIGVAMRIVNERNERKQQIAVSTATNHDGKSSYVIEIEDEKDFKLVELFMLSNNIKFKKVVK